jgi:site-specific DNA-methyltransferase (adenine-specific)
VPAGPQYGDTGSASRFFYSAKASKQDRAGSKHPTVKPVALMRYLCRLVTPKGGCILDPFGGSGTTGEAAAMEGFRATLIEREAEYVADIERRLGRVEPPIGGLF